MAQLAEKKQAIREAAGWYAGLCGDEVSEQERQDHERWLEASAANQQAWQQIGRLQQQMVGLPGQQAHQALQLGREYQLDRRQVLSILALISGGGALAWSGWRYTPLQDLTATYRTGKGEQQTQRLADGSELILNTDTAVDIEPMGRVLRIRLRRGEIQVTTAAYADKTVGQATLGLSKSAVSSAQTLSSTQAGSSTQTLLVETLHGQITPLGTRFMVRQFNHWTHVSVLEHSVRLNPAQSNQSLLLSQGQSAQMTATAIETLAEDTDINLHWPGGMLVISDWRLERLIQELGRYRSGILRCAPEVAGLKISGAYPVTDTDRALAAIARALPVTIQRVTPFWVSVHGT